MHCARGAFSTLILMFSAVLHSSPLAAEHILKETLQVSALHDASWMIIAFLSKESQSCKDRPGQLLLGPLGTKPASVGLTLFNNPARRRLQPSCASRA